MQIVLYKGDSTMSNDTLINPINNSSTEVNPNLSNNNATTVNVDAVGEILESGTILCSEYEVIKKLNVSSGEADLYLCKRNNNNYVAKVYRRKVAIKKEITKILQKINSRYIANLYTVGDINGGPVEILPYYKNGSLQGKKFSFKELQKKIIPNINEGLHELHKHNIIHKDVKPSNLMITQNGDINIIDFGVSSVTQSGNTIVVTQTGKTPEYSAPETFRELYLAESDYYSFGITIYELFTGTTPYNNINTEEREMYITMQKIPQPKNMPDELYSLILGLTYNDLTNRKDKSNPNRRWTYEEVKSWLNGENVVVPGSGHAASKQTLMQPYTFLGKKYTDTLSLVNALGANWESGKKDFYRGIISEFFKSVNPQLAGQIMDLESRGETDGSDITFFKVLYLLDNKFRAIYWKGSKYASLQDLGKKLQQVLWNEDNQNILFYGELLKNDVLSTYASCINNSSLSKALKGIERAYSIALSQTPKNKAFYQLVIILTGEKVFAFEGNKFTEVGQLSEYLSQKLEKSYSDFENSCKKLITESGNLDYRFEVWLNALGKKEAIEKWRRSLK